MLFGLTCLYVLSMPSSSGAMCVATRPVFLILALVVLPCCRPQYSGRTPPRAQNGVLDLSGWAFDKDGPVDLAGEWEFYWQQLVSPDADSARNLTGFAPVPGRFEQTEINGQSLPGTGYATYVLRVHLPPNAEEPGLRLLEQGMAYELFDGDRRLAGNGTVGTSANETEGEYRPLVVGMPPGSEHTLLLRLANFQHARGGFWYAPTIGLREQVQSLRTRDLGLELFLSGAISIMGLYHLGLYLVRRQDRAAMWFGFFCLIIVMRLLTTGERLLGLAFPALPLEPILRLEYLTFYAAGPIFILFVRSCFPADFNRWLVRSLLAPATLGCCAAVFLPVLWVTGTLTFYQVFILIACFIVIGVLVLAVVRKRRSAAIMLGGCLAFFAAVFFDILKSQLLLETPFLTPVGLFVFIFAQSGALSRRFAGAFKLVEELSQNLEQKVEERTAALESARSEAERERAISAGLADISKRLNETPDLGTLAKRVFDHVEAHYGLYTLGLFMADPTDTYLYVLAHTFPDTEEIASWGSGWRAKLEPASGSLYRTYKRQKPWYVPLVPDGDYPPIDAEALRMLGHKSFVHLPLVVEGKTIGIIFGARSHLDSPLKREDVRSMQAFADQIAGAVYTSQLLDRLENANRASEDARAETELLSELARKANENLDLDALGLLIQPVLDRRFGAPAVLFYTVNANAKRFDVRTTVIDGRIHPPGDSLPDSIPIGPDYPMWYIPYEKRKSLHVPNTARTPTRNELEDRFVRGHQLGWFINLPLLVEGEVVGLLGLGGRGKRVVTRAERVFCERVAAQVAGAVRARQILDESEDARGEIERLNKLTRRINETADLDTILVHVFRFFLSHMPAESILLYLVRGDRLEYYASTDESERPQAVDYMKHHPIDLRERGFHSRAIEERRPIHLRHLPGKDQPEHRTQNEQNIVRKYDLQSLLIVPLVIQDRAIATMNFTSFGRKMGLSREDIARIQRTCDQVAGAIRNSRLVQDLGHERAIAQRQRREAETIAQLSRQITESSSIETMIQSICNFVESAYGITFVWLLLVHEKRELRSRFMARSGRVDDNPTFANLKVPLDSRGGTLARTFRRGKPLFFSRIDPRWLETSPIDKQIADGFQLESFAHLPLRADGQSFGVLALTRSGGRMTLSSGERAQLQIMADQVAGALRIASQKEEVEKARSEIEKLSAFAKKVNETTDLDEILKSVFTYLEEEFGIEGIMLGVVEDDELRFFRSNVPESLTDEQIQITRSRVVPLDERGGAAYRTFKRKRSFYLANTDIRMENESDRTFVETLGVKSFLITPLLVQGDTIAILNCTSFSHRLRLSKADIAQISRFCDQIAGALQGAHLYQQAESAREAADKARQEAETARAEVEKLNAYSKKINETTDMDTILASLHAYVHAQFAIEGVWLLLIDRDTEELYTHSSTVYEVELPKAAVEFVEGFRQSLREPGAFSRTYRRNKPTYIPRVRRRGEVLPADKRIVDALGFESFLQMPLVIQDEVIAIIALTSYKGRLDLSRANIAAIGRFCEQTAGAIYSSTLLVEVQTQRAEAEIAKETAEIEQKKSDSLLLNILPKAVADELKERGEVEPMFYESVSVLFTDFVGFTKVAENMPPDELIAELDGCFTYFDDVVARNGLEKLKTIGDAYMCAGGLPQINETHSVDACLAALEFQAFMNQMKSIKGSMNLPFWELRLGIHSGPVTAGVVGKNKFAYDIWGDAVNTASRCESSGISGQVNISEDTYRLVLDFFECEYRGKVSAKGKGEIDMYFVNRIKPALSEDDEGLVPNAEFSRLYEELVQGRLQIVDQNAHDGDAPNTAPALKIAQRSQSTATVLDLSGEISARSAGDLKKAISEQISSEQSYVLLNLTEVKSIDSTGLGTIIHAYQSLSASGGVLAFAGTPPKIKSLFVASGLGEYMPMYESVELALTALEGEGGADHKADRSQSVMRKKKRRKPTGKSKKKGARSPKEN